jgi:hypothetical protein
MEFWERLPIGACQLRQDFGRFLAERDNPRMESLQSPEETLLIGLGISTFDRSVFITVAAVCYKVLELVPIADQVSF